jgi:hypothetical protein
MCFSRQNSVRFSREPTPKFATFSSFSRSVSAFSRSKPDVANLIFLRCDCFFVIFGVQIAAVADDYVFVAAQ